MPGEKETTTREAGQKGGRASMLSQKVSAAQLQVYLKGVDYPLGKKAIVEHARSRGAPENVMSFLTRLPEREYRYPTDVEEEFGKMK